MPSIFILKVSSRLPCICQRWLDQRSNPHKRKFQADFPLFYQLHAAFVSRRGVCFFSIPNHRPGPGRCNQVVALVTVRHVMFQTDSPPAQGVATSSTQPFAPPMASFQASGPGAAHGNWRLPPYCIAGMVSSRAARRTTPQPAPGLDVVAIEMFQASSYDSPAATRPSDTLCQSRAHVLSQQHRPARCNTMIVPHRIRRKGFKPAARTRLL